MLPKEIKQTRKKLKLSQEKFAFKVGTTAQSVSRWERGKFVPLPVFVERIKLLGERYVHESI